MGKVTQIQRHEHKKKFIFEVHTNVEGRVYLIAAESEALMKEWMDAVTIAWTLHVSKYVKSPVPRGPNSEIFLLHQFPSPTHVFYHQCTPDLHLPVQSLFKLHVSRALSLTHSLYLH